MADAIIDMADEDGITWQEARSKIINSAAYTALYDFENGLWENGPDYFRDYYKKIARAKKRRFGGFFNFDQFISH